MQYARLGTAGVKVSRLCLGTNMLGGYVDDAQGAELVNTFIECGGNFIDTSNNYNEGRSEEALGKALKGQRDQVVLATKVYSAMGEGPNDRGSSRYHIMHQAKASLRRLQTDYIDLYMLHFWDNDTPLEETLRAMDDLVRQGKVRYVGLSNFNAWQTVSALWTAGRLGLDPVHSVQTEYSFLKRTAEAELFPMAERHGLTITPFWVLRAGMFTGKYQRGQEPTAESRFGQRPRMAQMFMKDDAWDIAGQVEAVAKEAGRTPTAVTLSWALSKPVVSSVIAGTSRPEQVRENCAAVDIQLGAEELEALDAIGR